MSIGQSAPGATRDRGGGAGWTRPDRDGYDLPLDSAVTRITTHARAFQQHPGFTLLAGVDVDEARRQMFAQTYGLPRDVRRVRRPRAPSGRGACLIAGPTQQHGAILRQVLDASTPRAIVCEKPLAQDVAEARAMVETCAARGIALYVNYMRRSDPGAIEIKRRFDTGEIGCPAKGVAWYSKGFLHNGSHFFNVLEYWLGPIERAEVLDPGRLWNGVDPEPDVRVTFARGVVVFLAAREEAFSHATAELVTPVGRLRYDQGGEVIAWQPKAPDPAVPGYTILAARADMIPSGMDRYQWNVVEQLAAAIDGRPYALCSGAEALKTLESMSRIVEQR